MSDPIDPSNNPQILSFNNQNNSNIFNPNNQSLNYNLPANPDQQDPDFSLFPQDDSLEDFGLLPEDDPPFQKLKISQVFQGIKEIVIFAIPVLISLLFTINAINLINIYFMKQKDNDNLTAALGLGITYTNLSAIAFVVGFNQGLNTIAAQAYGAKGYQLMGVYFQRGVLLVLLLVLPFLLLLIFARQILTFLAVDPETAALCSIYTHYIIPAVFGIALFDALRVFLLAQDNIYPALIIQVSTGILHIFWAWLLIDRLNLDLEGAALARTITEWSNFIALLIYVRVSGAASQTMVPFGAYNTFEFQGLFEYAKYSLVVGSIVILDWFGLEVMTIMAGHFGPNEVVAHVAVEYLLNNDAIFAIGISTAVMTFVATWLGAACKNKARNYMFEGIILTSVIVVVYWLLVYFFQRDWADFFSNNPATDTLILKCIRPYLYGLIFFDTFQLVFGGVLKGIGKENEASIAVWISVYVIALPLAVLFGFYFKLEVYGLWIGYTIGIGCLAAFYSVQILIANWDVQMKEILNKIEKDNRELEKGEAGGESEKLLDIDNKAK